jgi:hypothetical protein
LRIDFDGRLTSIERVPAGDRPGLIDSLRKSGLLKRVLIPEDRAIFGMYEHLPGAWMLLEPFEAAQEVDRVEAASRLTRAVVACVRDGHLSALVKCPPMNAVAESFWSTLKEELVYQHSWPTQARARHAIFEFIEVFYNRQRLHSSLGYLSPAEYEARGSGQGEAVNAA